MRFGIFYEHQLPRPWGPGAEHKLLKDALDQIELADRLGFDYLWEVEHHFLEEYSHSSAPEVFLAAASQRTSRIRIGHGIVQLPFGFNHPARVAERIGTLDLISDGRVEFGTGEASSEMELGGFGVERATKRAAVDRGARCRDAPHGRRALRRPRGARRSPSRRATWCPSRCRSRTRRCGWPALAARRSTWRRPRASARCPSRSLSRRRPGRGWTTTTPPSPRRSASPAASRSTPTWPASCPFMCHQDEGTAIARGLDGGHFFGYSLAHYYAFGSAPPRVRPTCGTSSWRTAHASGSTGPVAAQEGQVLGAKLLERGARALRGAIGTPDQIRQLIRRYEEAGVDQLIFVSQAGRNRHEDICESMELFAREVMPEFAERADDVERAKEERLAGGEGGCAGPPRRRRAPGRTLCRSRRPALRRRGPTSAAPRPVE